MRKLLGIVLVVAAVLGALALMMPAPTVQAKDCIVCPQVLPLCGPCETLVAQTCSRCAYCKHIPGCQS